MSQQTSKTTVDNVVWSSFGRYKVGMNVSHNGSIWANSTGKNSEPGVGSDWVGVEKALEGYKETGTRAGGDLVVTIGDYDDSFNGTKVVIDTGNEKVDFFEAELVTEDFKVKNGINNFTSNIKATNLTADRNLELPDSDGTLATEEYVDSLNNVIEVNRYEDIPLEAGYYLTNKVNSSLGVYLNIPTNIYSYELEESLNFEELNEFFENTTYIVVKREFTGVNGESPDDAVLKITDTLYTDKGVVFGTTNPTDASPILIIDKSLFNSIYNDNYYAVYANSSNTDVAYYYGVIDIEIDNLNYSNGLLTIPYSFPDNIIVKQSNVYLGVKEIGEYKIGLIESETENKLGVLDYSGNFENALSGNVKILIEYLTSNSSRSDERVSPFLNNTRVNVVNLETEVNHSNAMVLTFNEVNTGFTGVLFDANSPNINDFKGNAYQTEIAENNVDFMFSSGSGISFLRNTSFDDFYGVLPIGSNNLIRQDLTDAIDKFPTNYIAVTSRSETDNDGTDPLGTSYGFGTEFNEPTLSADLTGQGLTDWAGSSEHQQSPATAIVSGKLKYIKDQTGASWDIIREACRQTASNANSYNIYRGFGVIDTASAIALIPTLEDARSLELAEYYEATTVMPLALKYEDKSLNTLVNKRDLGIKLNSITTGEPTGADAIGNIVSLTQAEYDAGTPLATTIYIITDA